MADRAIQQTIDSDELRERVGDLLDPEIVNAACDIIDVFFKDQDDTNDFLAQLMGGDHVEKFEQTFMQYGGVFHDILGSIHRYRKKI